MAHIPSPTLESVIAQCNGDEVSPETPGDIDPEELYTSCLRNEVVRISRENKEMSKTMRVLKHIVEKKNTRIIKLKRELDGMRVELRALKRLKRLKNTLHTSDNFMGKPRGRY